MRRVSLAALLFSLLLTGCGSDKPPMAEAPGVVIYNGQPLEGATVVYMPEVGPVGTGTTDAEGKFTIITAGEPEAVIGHGKVSITAVEQLIFPEPGKEIATKDLANMSRTLIPEKFGHVSTSGLTAEVKDDDNNLLFDLTGPPIPAKSTAPPKAPTPTRGLDPSQA